MISLYLCVSTWFGQRAVHLFSVTMEWDVATKSEGRRRVFAEVPQKFNSAPCGMM